MRLRDFALGLAAIACMAPQITSAQNAPDRNAPAKPPQKAPPARGAARPAQVQLAVPDNANLLILIRSGLEALNQANLTNNYSVLYLMGSDTFRRTNSPESLSQAFKPFRDNRVSFYPALILGPQLTRPATIDGGKLTLVGFFPSSPSRINFALQFELSQGVWKPLALDISLSANPQPAQQGQAQPPRP